MSSAKPQRARAPLPTVINDEWWSEREWLRVDTVARMFDTPVSTIAHGDGGWGDVRRAHIRDLTKKVGPKDRPGLRLNAHDVRQKYEAMLRESETSNSLPAPILRLLASGKCRCGHAEKLHFAATKATDPGCEGNDSSCLCSGFNRDTGVLLPQKRRRP